MESSYNILPIIKRISKKSLADKTFIHYSVSQEMFIHSSSSHGERGKRLEGASAWIFITSNSFYSPLWNNGFDSLEETSSASKEMILPRTQYRSPSKPILLHAGQVKYTQRAPAAHLGDGNSGVYRNFIRLDLLQDSSHGNFLQRFFFFGTNFKYSFSQPKGLPI